LHSAAGGGHEEVAELLLAKGADVNAKNNDGFTPLHSAAAQGHKDVAELLLAKGADANAKDKDGYIPLYWAAQMQHDELVTLLAPSLVRQLNDVDPTVRQNAASVLRNSGIVLADPQILNLMDFWSVNIVFYTSRQNPVSSLDDITNPDTQFGVGEFSQEMICLAQVLSHKPVAPDAQSLPFNVQPLGETSMSGGGVTLMGIGSDGFVHLFQQHPQLKLFAMPRGYLGTNIAGSMSDGIRVYLIARPFKAPAEAAHKPIPLGPPNPR
jgi:hypothetical protein